MTPRGRSTKRWSIKRWIRTLFFARLSKELFTWVPTVPATAAEAAAHLQEDWRDKGEFFGQKKERKKEEKNETMTEKKGRRDKKGPLLLLLPPPRK